MDTSRFLTHTITVRRHSGTNAYGDPTNGAATTMAARVQPGRDRGETIAHTHVVYTSAELFVDDEVWFPGDDTTDDTDARRPVSVSASPHPDGVTTLYKTLF